MGKQKVMTIETDVFMENANKQTVAACEKVHPFLQKNCSFRNEIQNAKLPIQEISTYF